MKKHGLSARLFKIILVLAILLIAAGGVSVFTFFYDQLNTFATEVGTIKNDAVASQKKISQLQRLEVRLEEEEESIKRAAEIVADHASYQYQDQVIHDLQTYAARSGISIIRYDFSQGNVVAKPKKSTSSSTSTSNTAGPKPTIITTTIKNPVNYNQFITFINEVEKNLTKMQISKLDMTRTPDGNIQSGTLEIEVYIQ